MAASNTRFTQNSLGQSKTPIDSDHGIYRYSGASSSSTGLSALEPMILIAAAFAESKEDTIVPNPTAAAVITYRFMAFARS